jgi:beta-fructofuranosidase
MRIPGLLGPFEPAQAVPFLDSPHLFAAPLVQARDGGWVYLGFENREQDGILSFEIVDPIPVRFDGKAVVLRE